MDINLRNSIFGIADDADFKNMALAIFEYQYRTNAVYQLWAKCLNNTPETVSQLTELPFLPVEFFKNHIIVSGSEKTQKIFESSGTTNSSVSKHHVTDLDLYAESFIKTFRMFYGNPSEYIITALLPAYTERGNSSLVYMVNSLIKMSNNPLSGFYNMADNAFIDNITSPVNGKKRLLFGVSFALLDLATKHPDLSGSTVMETGGMKGKRKEITRHELHKTLAEAFNIPVVHSEYGMTELLSQAYSKGNGVFYPPPWMKIVLRDLCDPLTVFTEPGQTGGINIIDLANINSCSFIATGDIGKLLPGGGFEVLGRFDNSDIRGCNLLTENFM
ncbi:MAG: acyltransferase [Bacteroidales bacterium]|jgi:phenylacetate-coenzyme A ligase PaaK-like adenylate-forming protein|nr:acyltransferase [Bacteroidales bacterium]